MLNFFFLFFLISLSSWAQDDQPRSYYTAAPECFVKRYRNKELEIVSDKMFRNIGLITKELRRNPQFKAFKVNGDVYLAPTECLKPKAADEIDDLDNLAVSDQGREEKSLQEVYREERQSTRDNSSSSSSFNRNKYYIEISGGIRSVPDQNSVVPDYNTTFIGDPAYPLHFSTIAKSKYTSNKLIQIDLGKKNSDIGFYALKVRFSGGEKTDSFTVAYTVPSSGSVDTSVKYTDSNLGTYLGYKLLFFQDSSFRPFITGFAGLNFGSLKISSSYFSFPEHEATSLGLIAEGGFEYIFTSYFGLNLNLAYEYIGPKTWKVKGSTNNTTNTATGFKSKMSYSNIAGASGLIFYW